MPSACAQGTALREATTGCVHILWVHKNRIYDPERQLDIGVRKIVRAEIEGSSGSLSV
jgi:hypothetical protein